MKDDSDENDSDDEYEADEAEEDDDDDDEEYSDDEIGSGSRKRRRGAPRPAGPRKKVVVPKDRPNHYGAVPGLPIGKIWETRLECCADGIHRPTVAGIHGGNIPEELIYDQLICILWFTNRSTRSIFYCLVRWL